MNFWLCTVEGNFTVCTECVWSSYFALSMTSDNTFLIFNAFSDKACYSLCECACCFLCKSILCPCSHVYMCLHSLRPCGLEYDFSAVWSAYECCCCCCCWWCVCVCFPDYINTVSFSVSAPQQNPNRQQEIRQAWSPITTTVTIQRPPCIPATRKWAN